MVKIDWELFWWKRKLFELIDFWIKAHDYNFLFGSKVIRIHYLGEKVSLPFSSYFNNHPNRNSYASIFTRFRPQVNTFNPKRYYFIIVNERIEQDSCRYHDTCKWIIIEFHHYSELVMKMILFTWNCNIKYQIYEKIFFISH